MFDLQTHRRMRDFEFCALSFERHGFWAKETVGFVKKLATSRAVALGLEPSEEIRRWYAAISCCIQRSNAKVLRGEPVPGRPTPPRSRFAATKRDLSLQRNLLLAKEGVGCVVVGSGIPHVRGLLTLWIWSYKFIRPNPESH